MENIYFRKSWFKTLRRYEPEMVVEFMNGLEDFLLGNPVEIKNDRVLDLWEQVEPLLLNDKVKYQNVVERNKENGKKGGRPKTQPVKPETQKTHSVILETQENPKKPKEKEKEKEKENEREKENEILKENISPVIENLTHTHARILDKLTPEELKNAEMEVDKLFQKKILETYETKKL